eukprot:2937618-Rhodomonas_salina.1
MWRTVVPPGCQPTAQYLSLVGDMIDRYGRDQRITVFLATDDQAVVEEFEMAAQVCPELLRGWLLKTSGLHAESSVLRRESSQSCAGKVQSLSGSIHGLTIARQSEGGLARETHKFKLVRVPVDRKLFESSLFIEYRLMLGYVDSKAVTDATMLDLFLLAQADYFVGGFGSHFRSGCTRSAPGSLTLDLAYPVTFFSQRNGERDELTFG